MATTASKTPRRPTGTDLDAPYVAGDSIPAPEAVERSGESVWALWPEVTRQHNTHSAETQPAAGPSRLNSEDQGWAKPQPAMSRSIPQLPRKPRDAHPLFTLEAAMLVARR